MSIHIRFAEPGDRAGWEVLWRGYQAFYETDLGDGEDALWARLMSATGEGPYALVAVDDERDGRLVGLAHYLYHATTWSDAPRCYLNDLFTAADTRGMGVGRALIEAVYEKADAHGAGQVYWLTQQSNKTARKLYDRIGQLTEFIKYVR